jgi:hypothetical protein
LGLVSADIKNATAGTTSRSDTTEFALDLKAGTAVELVGPADGSRKSARVWVSLEAGYAYMSKSTLRFVPDSGSGPERAQALDAGELSLSGLAFGFLLVGSY